MKAYVLESYDGPDGLHLGDVEEPQPGPDDLLIEVDAIGINYPDLLLTRGEYQLKPDLPFVPGCEVAGAVLTAPSGSGWKPGDRVGAFIWQGGFAERTLVPAAVAARLPDQVTSVTAAASMVNYHTVTFALVRRARLQAGEKVLVMGAAGGIGTAAIQVAKGLGATVVAGVADAAQVRVAQSAGADDVILLEPGFAKSLNKRGAGIDVVVDPVGDWLFDEALRCLEPEGRLIVLGFAAGKIPNVAVNRLLLRNVAVIGAAFGAFLDREPGLVAHQSEFIFDLAERGVVAPQIDRVLPLEQLPDGLHALASGKIRGKAVVELGADR